MARTQKTQNYKRKVFICDRLQGIFQMQEQTGIVLDWSRQDMGWIEGRLKMEQDAGVGSSGLDR